VLISLSRWLVAGLVVAVLLSGCGTAYRANGGGEDRPTPAGKIRAEAYLFDSRIKHDGRTTSVRLDLYRTDTLIGFAGRGYLGKGAFKGWITAESLLVYMPRSNEYVHEAIAELELFDSTSYLDELKLLRLFVSLPQPEDLSHLVLTSEIDDPKRPHFEIVDPESNWRLNLTYDKEEDGWRIRHFDLDDGRDFQLEANRRRFKADANLSVAAFQVTIPPHARRITP
jgi:hypothetical protein